MPSPHSTCLVHEHLVDFQWEPGAAAEQKRANVSRLHKAAAIRNLSPLLEVSPFANDPAGERVAVSRLTLKDENSYFGSVTALYHGSKVFVGGGPFTDLYRADDQTLTTDRRLKESGPLAGFRFGNLEWGLKAQVMFYDWLVVQAIHCHRDLRGVLAKYEGFTDVDCRVPATGICHARSCALYVGLEAKKIVDKVIADQDLFIETLIRDPNYQE